MNCHVSDLITLLNTFDPTAVCRGPSHIRIDGVLVEMPNTIVPVPAPSTFSAGGDEQPSEEK